MAFDHEHPYLAEIIKITETLGYRFEADNYTIGVSITEEKPQEGIPYGVSLTIQQLDRDTKQQQKEKKQLKRKIRWNKAKGVIGAVTPPNSAERQTSYEMVKGLEVELEQSGLHTVTYYFNPKTNQFEGVTYNTDVKPEPIPADKFKKICKALFSVVPVEAVEAVDPFHGPITILAQPKSGQADEPESSNDTENKETN
jgi:hypothetical protein